MNKWFELIDNQTGKRYRISYDKTISNEKRERWRKEWKAGKISFECGCGCPFGINAKGAMYYPADLANRNGERRHLKSCVKYRKEIVKEREVLILSDIPKKPKDAGIYRLDWLLQCEGWNDVERQKQLLKELYCFEDGVEKKLNQYVKDIKTVKENCRFLLFGIIKEVKCYPYGFRKLTVYTQNKQYQSIWLADTFLASYEDEIEINDMFVGFCFIRHEKWKNNLYRKIYVLEGLIA